MKAIHWSGGIKIISKKGLEIRERLWPACCSGAPAFRIRYHGKMTRTDPKQVTCKRCQRLLRKAGLLEKP